MSVGITSLQQSVLIDKDDRVGSKPARTAPAAAHTDTFTNSTNVPGDEGPYLDTVTFNSKVANDTGSTGEVRWERVLEARATIANGTWKIPAAALGAALVEKGALELDHASLQSPIISEKAN